MPYYAQISAGRVVAITETSGAIAAGNMVPLSSLDFGLVGYGYANGVFTAPAPIPRPRHITRLAFARRFTIDEEADIEIAGTDSPTGPPAARKALARARVASRRVNTSAFIDLDDSATRATVQGYETANLLANGRAAQILDAPITEGERP